MFVEDLRVYKDLFELAFEVHQLTLSFPQFELYELGSQMRRSSNSAPANLAEGFNNKHTNTYLECISRAKGEILETRHHLRMAHRKAYLNSDQLNSFLSRYDEGIKMLYGLEKSLLIHPRR